jgi:hypothetical protein
MKLRIGEKKRYRNDILLSLFITKEYSEPEAAWVSWIL